MKWIFWGFNALMAWWLIAGMNQAADSMSGLSGAQHTGAAIGTGIGAMLIIFIWAAGAIILGMIFMFTRAKGGSTCSNVNNLASDSSSQALSAQPIRCELRGCPYCKEQIRIDAILCKHCKSKVEPEEIVLKPATYGATGHDHIQSDKNVGYIVIALIILSVLIYKMM